MIPRPKAVVYRVFSTALALGLAVPLFFFQPALAHAQTSTNPAVTITTTQAEVAEGGLAAFTVKRSGGSLTNRLAVQVRTWEPNKTGTEQFHDVTISRGFNVATLNVVAYVDDRYDPSPDIPPYYPHTLNAEIVASDDGSYQVGSPGSASMDIVDINDPPFPLPRIAIQLHHAPITVDEGNNATFTLIRNGGDTSQPLTVDILVDDPNGYLRGNLWGSATRPSHPCRVPGQRDHQNAEAARSGRPARQDGRQLQFDRAAILRLSPLGIWPYSLPQGRRYGQRHTAGA